MKKSLVLLYLTIVLGAFLRLYGLNWDQGQHLHPDERFLTMVTNALQWPQNLSEYFDPDTSPLNPRNVNFPFFVYGTFPLFIVKGLGQLIGWDTYEQVPYVGRILSALFDVATIALVYGIARDLVRLSKKVLKPSSTYLIPLSAAFFYAISTLPIQLSHFYTVDMYVVTFLTMCFFLLMRLFLFPSRAFIYASLIGIFFGMALASKISAVLFAPVIALGISLYPLFLPKPPRPAPYLLTILMIGSATLATTYAVLRLANPYMFESPSFINPTINTDFLNNLGELKSWDGPESNFPPSLQWISTTPILFSLRTIVYYGLGIPLGILTLAGIAYLPLVAGRLLVHTGKKHTAAAFLLLWFWVVALLLFQSVQFVKAIRYFSVIYPFMAICAAFSSSRALEWIYASCSKTSARVMVIAFVIVLLAWPVAFIHIYHRDHSRVSASRWIYEHIPAGTAIACEHWDDCLPLPLEFEGKALNHTRYTQETLPLYDEDRPEKWQSIGEKLQTVDYIILSSNRLYGSITSVQHRYPESARYYRRLFDGSLGYEKVAEFTSRPTIPFPMKAWCITLMGDWYGIVAQTNQACDGTGIQVVDDYAEESFTVYDHPKVSIFKKTQSVIPTGLPE